LVFTVGNGIVKFLLNVEDNQFVSVKSDLKIPEQTQEYAINSSNSRYWPTPVRSYIEELIDGAIGPRKKNYNTRWVASLVAETHRILERGGVFLYPGDDREGFSEGRLRKIYECGPIAFLIEQALGLATNGIEPIVGLTADNLHQRTPFVFGSKEEVETIKKFYEDPKSAHAPLFRTRGLFNR
jgi:fructose-1,6-bisphosphatase I